MAGEGRMANPRSNQCTARASTDPESPVFSIVPGRPGRGAITGSKRRSRRVAPPRRCGAFYSPMPQMVTQRLPAWRAPRGQSHPSVRIPKERIRRHAQLTGFGEPPGAQTLAQFLIDDVFTRRANAGPWRGFSCLEYRRLTAFGFPNRQKGRRLVQHDCRVLDPRRA